MRYAIPLLLLLFTQANAANVFDLSGGTNDGENIFDLSGGTNDGENVFDLSGGSNDAQNIFDLIESGDFVPEYEYQRWWERMQVSYFESMTLDQWLTIGIDYHASAPSDGDLQELRGGDLGGFAK